MNSSLKFALSLAAALCAAPFASAQVTLQDFSAYLSPNTSFVGDWELNGDIFGSTTPRASFSQGIGVYNFTGGSNNSNSGTFYFFDSSLNITGLSLLEVSGRILTGNTAPTFAVTLFDSIGNTAVANFLTAPLVGPDLRTLHSALLFSSEFDRTDVAGFEISGGVLNGNAALNLSAGNLAVVAVPEPSTYGLCAALALVGFVAVKRRRQGSS